MADEIGRMSEEDRFLGVRTTIDTSKPDEVDIEVVDDRPEGDQRAPAAETLEEGDTASDEELSQLGNRAQNALKS